MSLNPQHAQLLSPHPHGFFGRSGGVSEGETAGLNAGPGSGDDLTHVRENRDRVRKALKAEHLVTAYQTHSAIARYVDAPWPDDAAPRADGLVTDRPGLAIGVLAADCVPVLFADGPLVGAAHAGWRGSLEGILEATVDLMVAHGAMPARIRCAIGPALRAPAFEVGEDLIAAVTGIFPEAHRFFTPREISGKHTYDHIGFVRWRLESAGIPPDRIEDVGGCTLTHPDTYFSYRASRQSHFEKYGRNVSAITSSMT